MPTSQSPAVPLRWLVDPQAAVRTLLSPRSVLFMCVVTTAMNVMMGALISFTFDKVAVQCSSML